MSVNIMSERKDMQSLSVGEIRFMLEKAIETRDNGLEELENLSMELKKDPENVQILAKIKKCEDALGFINVCIANYEGDLRPYNNQYNRKDNLTFFLLKATDTRTKGLQELEELSNELKNDPNNKQISRRIERNRDALGFICRCIADYELELRQYKNG